jgi:hypothetical protein
MPAADRGQLVRLVAALNDALRAAGGEPPPRSATLLASR